MIRKRNVIIVAAIMAMAVLVAGPACAADKKFFAITTGGTGGLYYPLGGLLAQALTDRVPEVVATGQAGNASVANCNLIKDHQIESAFVQNNVAFNAYNGKAEFDGKQVKNLRGIASLYPESIQIVARADSGIKSLKDIRGKRLIPGDRGSGTLLDAQNIISGYGMTNKDFASVDWLGFSGAAQRLQDKQADVTFITAGWPTAAIVELAMSTEIVLVPIEEDIIKNLTKTFPFYSRIVVPKDTYKGMKTDVATITVMAQWVVDEQVPEDLVYKLTRALWEKSKDGLSGADVLAKVHAKGKDVQLKTALSGMAIPLHPGAAKYYREIGLIK
ncbi:MAG: TAXI family TRAP transporter solute-binding subunit [Deltaproteobacteria bacterium]|nr:TAXI family TRAP transporter solute-binding subunit [Deltaproteobacteria bacterium]